MNELTHYGVLGMKWGIRKDDSSNAMKTAKSMRENINNVSNKDLQDILTRLDMEKRLRDITNSQKTIGSRTIKTFEKLMDLSLTRLSNSAVASIIILVRNLMNKKTK